MSADDPYAQTPDYFGSAPDSLLCHQIGQLDLGRPVLDVGAGQGRHSLFLARRGFCVEAIDPSSVAIQQLLGAAQAENLSLRAQVSGFESWTAPAGGYGAILVFGLLPVLRAHELEKLRGKIADWTAVGSLLLMTAFTTADPTWDAAGGRFATYMKPGEILAWFPNWTVLHHWEGDGPPHRHGPEGPLHHHGLVEVMLRRAAR